MGPTTATFPPNLSGSAPLSFFSRTNDWSAASYATCCECVEFMSFTVRLTHGLPSGGSNRPTLNFCMKVRSTALVMVASVVRLVLTAPRRWPSPHRLSPHPPYLPRAVQSVLGGGQVDFVWFAARAPHGGVAQRHVWRAERTQKVNYSHPALMLPLSSTHTSRPAFMACAAACVSFSFMMFLRMFPTAEQSDMTTASGLER